VFTFNHKIRNRTQDHQASDHSPFTDIPSTKLNFKLHFLYLASSNLV